MSEHTTENDAASRHEHDVSCAFGNPTCPAFGEPEPPQPSLWRRLLTRVLSPGVSPNDDKPRMSPSDDTRVIPPGADQGGAA